MALFKLAQYGLLFYLFYQYILPIGVINLFITFITYCNRYTILSYLNQKFTEYNLHQLKVSEFIYHQYETVYFLFIESKPTFILIMNEFYIIYQQIIHNITQVLDFVEVKLKARYPTCESWFDNIDIIFLLLDSLHGNKEVKHQLPKDNQNTESIVHLEKYMDELIVSLMNEKKE